MAERFAAPILLSAFFISVGWLAWCDFAADSDQSAARAAQQAAPSDALVDIRGPLMPITLAARD